MEFFKEIFITVLYQPLFNALVFLYQYLPGKDFGVAIIVLTLLIRILVYPLMVKSLKSQKQGMELQPKIKEIQNKYKDDKEKQTKALMELYQKEKINPFGGCLPLLVQLPILIALYRVFWRGLDPGTLNYLYSFVPNPGVIDPNFIGLINLSQPNMVITVIAGFLQFLQGKMFAPKMGGSSGDGKKDLMSDIMKKQTIYFFPLITVVFLFRLPSAIGIYWIVTTLFSIGQQYFIFKQKKNEPEKS
ncbi:MAG: YidC/Oxa1 family membrane protein insertase [Candidatus Pacebacteria bacterium]|nr:YidC/Oxa1 family membrane protein insertase [Candidatus Paceibacterota bacterium]